MWKGDFPRCEKVSPFSPPSCFFQYSFWCSNYSSVAGFVSVRSACSAEIHHGISSGTSVCSTLFQVWGHVLCFLIGSQLNSLRFVSLHVSLSPRKTGTVFCLPPFPSCCHFRSDVLLYSARQSSGTAVVGGASRSSFMAVTCLSLAHAPPGDTQ